VDPFGVRMVSSARDFCHVVSSYTGDVSAEIVCHFDSARELAGDRPPTNDDVPIARDGRRLDTPDKVIAFLEEINARRDAATRRAG
jgi:hypothetical protein